MPMIEQVDVPGLLALYTGTRQRSLENQYRAEQIARQRQEDQRAEERRILIGKVFSGPGAATPPIMENGSAAPAPEPLTDLDQFMPGKEPGMLANGQPVGSMGSAQPSAPATLIDPAQLPPRTDGLNINQEALRQLYAVDPESALKIQQHIYDADEATFKRIQQRGAAMAQVAGALLQEPTQEGRIAAFRQAAPQLQALGFTPEQLNQVDLSDAGLNRYFRAGMSMEQIIGEKKDARDYALRERQFEESSRHNRATEGVSAGNLALARQREGRITKWGPQTIVVGGAVAPRTDTSDLDY